MVDTDVQHILVIDDEPRIASLLQRQLGAAGFAVQTVDRGTTALTQIQLQLPDLVIVDLRLPDLSGYELCWILRRLYDRPRLPILVLTGVEQSTEQLHREAAEADAYLHKPYDAVELLRTVRGLLHCEGEESS